MSELATVEVEIDITGHGKIIVNGEDVAKQVASMNIIMASSEPTKVFIETITQGAKFKGPGIVYLKGEVLPISTVLRSLDPSEVDKAALDRQGWGDEKSLTEHIIDIICEAADATES